MLEDFWNLPNISSCIREGIRVTHHAQKRRGFCPRSRKQLGSSLSWGEKEKKIGAATSKGGTNLFHISLANVLLFSISIPLRRQKHYTHIQFAISEEEVCLLVNPFFLQDHAKSCIEMLQRARAAIDRNRQRTTRTLLVSSKVCIR